MKNNLIYAIMIMVAIASFDLSAFAWENEPPSEGIQRLLVLINSSDNDVCTDESYKDFLKQIPAHSCVLRGNANLFWSLCGGVPQFDNTPCGQAAFTALAHGHSRPAVNVDSVVAYLTGQVIDNDKIDAKYIVCHAEKSKIHRTIKKIAQKPEVLEFCKTYVTKRPIIQ